MTLLLQVIVSGLAAGMVYALIALGFSLVYRTGRVINFVQGDFALLTGYLAYTLMAVGLPVALACVIGVIDCIWRWLRATVPGPVSHRPVVGEASRRKRVSCGAAVCFGGWDRSSCRGDGT